MPYTSVNPATLTVATTGPAGPPGAQGNPAVIPAGTWSSIISYSQFDGVSASDGSGGTAAFVSLSNANLGNTPSSSPTLWYKISGSITAGRPLATSNMTFYVATTGNDSNPGTSGAPFLTIPHAIAVVQSYDWNNFTGSIQLANGTYNIANIGVFGALVGSGEFFIEGNGSSPSSVVINVAAAGYGFYAKDLGIFTITGVTFVGAGAGATALQSAQLGCFDFYNVIFGDFTGGVHMNVLYGGSANDLGGYQINGNAITHLGVAGTFNLSGTNGPGADLAFSYFLEVSATGVLYMNGSTWNAGSYTVTGQNYLISQGGQVVSDTNLDGSTIGNVTGRVWADPPALGVTALRTVVNDTNYAATVHDSYIAVTALTAARTITLPLALLLAGGQEVVVADESGSAGTHNITVSGGGPEGIQGPGASGGAIAIAVNYGSVRVKSNGLNQYTITGKVFS